MLLFGDAIVAATCPHKTRHFCLYDSDLNPTTLIGLCELELYFRKMYTCALKMNFFRRRFGKFSCDVHTDNANKIVQSRYSRYVGGSNNYSMINVVCFVIL